MSHRSRQKEHGEVLEQSPERSPEIEIAAQEDWGFSGDDEQHNDQSYDREDDDSLDIKPPQAHAKREKAHKHRDKEGRHRDKADRERGKHVRERGDKDRGVASAAVAMPPVKERGREDRMASRPTKHPKKTGTDKDAEVRRRERSQRERERLERLERERYRIEREQRDRLQRAEREKDRERSEKIGRTRKGEDSRRRMDKIDSDHRRSKHSDKYSSHDRSRSPRREARGMREERSHGRRSSPRDDMRSVVLRPEQQEEVESIEHEEEEEDVHRSEHSEVTPREEISEDERSDVSEARSPSVVSHHSVSGSASESEAESRSPTDDEHHRNGAEQHDNGRHTSKVKSKFDPSDDESETQSVQHSPPEDDYLDDSPERSPIELKPELPDYFPAIQGCRSVEEFNCLNRIAEGTYGVVYRAKDKKTGELVALKRLKMEKEKEGFPITSLREINTLLKAQHPNIVTVREIVVGSNMDKIYIVMDYVEHDLKSLMESMKDPFITGEVKTLMIQLLRGVAHLHDNWIIHRDLKTSNLLLGHNGILKIGDFGLAREYGSPLKQYTPIVVTLWYRAPELLLGTKEYSCPIDMWSVGCIFAELITRKPLFPGKSEIDQLNKIFKELGTPTEKIWPGVGELPAMKKCSFAEYPYNQLRNKFGSMLSDKGFDLMNRFLTYNPGRRILADDALKHEYFAESPAPVNPNLFPTWPAKSEMTRSRATHGPSSPKPPSGGKAFAKLLGDDDVATVQPVAPVVASNMGAFHFSHATKGAAASGPGFSLKF